jgi:amino acid adenylation domain-containing protein
LLNYSEQPDSALISCDGLTVQQFSPPSTAAKFDLRLVIDDEPDAMRAGLQYRRDLFDHSTVTCLAMHLTTLLEGLAATPDRPVSGIRLDDAAEPATVEDSLAAQPHPPLPDAIRAHGLRHPTEPAVIDGRRSLTYAELNSAADRLARHLNGLGIGPDSVVALALPPTVDLAIGVLGVWRAGGAYLAVDQTDPLDRVKDKLDRASVAVVVTDDATTAELPATTSLTVCLDEVPSSDEQDTWSPPLIQPDSLAYLVYTSGSTGTPKPVAITHRGLSAYAHAMNDRLAPQPGKTWALVAPLSVDLGITSVAMAWLNAGTLRLVDPALLLRPRELAGALAEPRVDYLKITPTQLELLLAEPAARAALPHAGLLLGGEASSARLVASLRTAGYTGALYNHYGPAETTVGVLTHRIDTATVDRPPPLGQPLAGVICRVLDRRGNPAPAGVPGELYVGGPGLARGYLRRPEQTAERFVADPFRSDGARLYRTGDLVRRDTAGTLTFLGRVDDQVNLRGLRIEPGEVEAALGAHPAVAMAAVDVRPDPTGGRRLVCWVVPSNPDAPPDRAELRTFLARRLPAPLIPALFSPVDALPLTRSGKLDRRALPDPSDPATRCTNDPPVTDTECTLAELWGGLLGVRGIQRGDDFFDLGGHSLLAIQSVSRVRVTFGVELPLATLFDQPTLAEVASVIDTLRWIAVGAEAADLDWDIEEMTL